MRQMTTRTLLTVSVLTVGCATELPIAAMGPSAIIIMPVEADKVTGSGHIDLSGQLRTFAFNAKVQNNGTVNGQWQTNNRLAGTFALGSVTCLTAIGNQAWIGGVIESSSDPAIVGFDAFWRVVDNGEGSAAPPDEISQIPLFLPAGSAQDYCNTAPQSPALHLIQAGNIQMH